MSNQLEKKFSFYTNFSVLKIMWAGFNCFQLKAIITTELEKKKIIRIPDLSFFLLSDNAQINIKKAELIV